jgi:taurine--2-oxoglutarate transaminase
MSFPYYFSWTKQNGASNFNIESVDGVKLYSTNHKEIIDMSSISYQAHFGHNHPTIISHLKKQLDSIPMSSPKGVFAGKNEATNSLLKYMNLPDGKIFYTSGGAETIENALKIARDITRKKIVLARSNSYHGATLGALTATGDWRNPPHQLPNDWVVRIPEPHEDDAISKTREIILKHGPQNIAAFILETITGGNGVIIPTKEWWKGIQDLCDEFNILLIMDEVICGFERTGKSFGYMYYDVKPDLVCMAKGITGGMIPFGALWTSHKISKHYDENILCCGLTNYAHPMGISAMQAVLEIVHDEKFKLNLLQAEKTFSEELEKLKKLKIVKAIRNIGMISAVDLHKTVEWKKFIEGQIYLVAQNNRIIIAPPLIIDPPTLIEGMNRIYNVLKINE